LAKINGGAPGVKGEGFAVDASVMAQDWTPLILLTLERAAPTSAENSCRISLQQPYI
jgi:hypothetical protein